MPPTHAIEKMIRLRCVPQPATAGRPDRSNEARSNEAKAVTEHQTHDLLSAFPRPRTPGTPRTELESRMTELGLDDHVPDRFQGRAQARDLAHSLLSILAVRGFEVSGERRAAVESCQDIGLLRAWLDRSITAVAADEVFGED